MKTSLRFCVAHLHRLCGLLAAHLASNRGDVTFSAVSVLSTLNWLFPEFFVESIEKCPVFMRILLLSFNRRFVDIWYGAGENLLVK